MKKLIIVLTGTLAILNTLTCHTFPYGLISARPLKAEHGGLADEDLTVTMENKTGQPIDISIHYTMHALCSMASLLPSDLSTVQGNIELKRQQTIKPGQTVTLDPNDFVQHVFGCKWTGEHVEGIARINASKSSGKHGLLSTTLVTLSRRGARVDAPRSQTFAIVTDPASRQLTITSGRS